MKKVVILYSGGLDSRIMYRMAEQQNYDITLLYYDYGNPDCLAELETLPESVTVRKVQWFDNSTDRLLEKSTEKNKGAMYIPGRNLVFIILAACQELPDEIWLGSTYNEVNDLATDKNLTFKDKTEELINYTLKPFKNNIKVRYPIYEAKMDKEEIIDWMFKNNFGDDVRNSISCYHPINNKECGICHQCMKKRISAEKNGYKLEFVNDFMLERNWIESYLKDFIKNNKPINYSNSVAVLDLDFPQLYITFLDYNLDWSNELLDDLEQISLIYKKIKANNENSI